METRGPPAGCLLCTHWTLSPLWNCQTLGVPSEQRSIPVPLSVNKCEFVKLERVRLYVEVGAGVGVWVSWGLSSRL